LVIINIGAGVIIWAYTIVGGVIQFAN